MNPKSVDEKEIEDSIYQELLTLGDKHDWSKPLKVATANDELGANDIANIIYKSDRIANVLVTIEETGPTSFDVFVQPDDSKDN